MAVYVGNLEWPFRNMIMFHMVADTLEELHDMADKIGVNRKWFQPFPEHVIAHYDICKSKKVLALNYGAVEMSDREIVKRFRVHEKLFNNKSINKYL